MNLKEHFSRFIDADPARLHFAAHSHHPWPDVSYEAHRQAWVDAATLADDKWEHIFGSVIPRTKDLIASIIGIESGETLVFAPNTHEFVVRLFSCLEPPARVLTTDSEFHSFSRQCRRWEEAGLAIVDRVPAEPYETFTERFTTEVRSDTHDLIYLSSVFFNSGFVVPELDRIVSSVSNERCLVAIDGYHSFMALPVDLGAIQDRAFFLAGGYKYAMAGEGVCFMHCPPGYAPRPVDTGWYAGFGQLETGPEDLVSYASDGTRFAGATLDPSGIYRLEAVLGWLRDIGVTPEQIHTHAASLQRVFLEETNVSWPLTPPRDHERGNFLTFELDDPSVFYRRLHDSRVITDYRGNRLRIGFGIYHDMSDVHQLADVVREVAAS